MAGIGRSSRRGMRASGMRSRSRRRLRLALKSGVIVFMGLAMVLFVGVVGATPGDRPPGGRLSDPTVRAVDVAEPAVVRIAALYQARISLTLCGHTVTLPAAGDSFVTGGVGTGAFVSANGDILTADHVVDIPQTSLDTEIFQGAQSADLIARALNSATCLHFAQSVTASDVAAGIVQYDNIPYQTAYSDPQRLVWQSTDYSGPSTVGDAQDLLSSLMNAPHLNASVTSSSSFDDNDLALLKVDLTDTPSIQLADSASVAAEDTLTILGFPGNGDVSTNATDLLIPSINTVSVSAIKDGGNGSKLIQVAGNVEHGDSGGPALDSTGAIVGVVSFGGTDVPGSTAFLRASANALTLMHGAGVNASAGTFQTRWSQAFGDYSATYRGHWRKAARELDALSAQYPSFAGVKPYQQYADSAARTEPATDSRAFAYIILAGAFSLLVLAVTLTLVLTLQRRSARRRPVAPQVALAQVMYRYPYNPYGYNPTPYPYAPNYPPYPAYPSGPPTGATIPPSTSAP
ncbi:MAG TPA: serine protease, partial [Ktedonobacterales bacterium]|nr:serine protease [Ktedonobacterales bacterium]